MTTQAPAATTIAENLVNTAASESQETLTKHDEHTDQASATAVNTMQSGDPDLELMDKTKHVPIEVAGAQLVAAFNKTPYLTFNQMEMRFEDDTIRCYLDARRELVGNTHFNILHGGVAATMLDSIAGIVAMLELYRRDQGTLSEQHKKMARLATVDLRVDYLAPGRGKQYIASAEVIRMGRKGCTMRMEMVNDEGKSIAMGIATFAY